MLIINRVVYTIEYDKKLKSFDAIQRSRIRTGEEWFANSGVSFVFWTVPREENSLNEHSKSKL